VIRPRNSTSRRRSCLAADPAAAGVTGITRSIDNLTPGIALGTCHVNLAVGAISVTMSPDQAGARGGRLDTKAGERGELFGVPVIIAVASGILCTSR
jgi:putative Mn2+ efflux pump MntP